MLEKLYHLGMRTRSTLLAAAALVFACGLAVGARQQAPAQGNPNGWQIPPEADQEKNPFAGDAKALATGKELYSKNCQRCHGPGGKGDGPDADPDAMQDMDLTVARRAARNPDGIVFYKAWNGRKKPKMPAVKDTLTKEQLWQIVTYVQTLRSSQ
jgi:mono/diheme cytochrome c family protein